MTIVTILILIAYPLMSEDSVYLPTDQQLVNQVFFLYYILIA